MAVIWYVLRGPWLFRPKPRQRQSKIVYRFPGSGRSNGLLETSTTDAGLENLYFCITVVIGVLRLNQLHVSPIQATKPICSRSQNQSGNAYRVGRFRRPGIRTYFRLRGRGKLYCATLSYYRANVWPNAVISAWQRFSYTNANIDSSAGPLPQRTGLLYATMADIKTLAVLTVNLSYSAE